MGKCLVSLTNILTPYRLHFYNTLTKYLQENDIILKVFFMAHTEPGRYWVFHNDDYNFYYKIFNGAHPFIGGRQFHINPGVIYQLLRSPPDWLLVSGSWYFPTAFLSTMISHRLGVKTLFWAESNLEYIEHRSLIVNRFRSMVMNGFDAYVVPGVWARDYVLTFAQTAMDKPIITLPNVVDESNYQYEVALRRQQKENILVRWGFSESKRPIIFLGARLEPIKGVSELIDVLINSSVGKQITLLIAGDGSLRKKILEIIMQSSLDKNIILLGFLDEDKYVDLLAISDAFILPSLGDPYPLAVIEALFAGLPLLISNRVGCHPEAVKSGENGFLFDPTSSSDIRNCLEKFVKIGSPAWEKMGERSLEIARLSFMTNTVIRHFVDSLLSV